MMVFASAWITDVDDEVVEGFSGLDMLPKTINYVENVTWK